jgi:hypothetical protein
MWTSNDAKRTIPYEFNDTTQHPARVDRYVICEISGAGAMGVVYRAYDPELGRAVAIKLVRAGASNSDQARLFREAQAMAQLRHPNVVPIFDVGLAPGGVFLAMALLDGGTLRQWIHRARHPLDAILDKFVAAGHGLEAAHSAGIVHRDFKPDNVLLDAHGEVLVADFGLARLTVHGDGARPDTSLVQDDSLTQSGQIMGTPAYMSPEQLRGQHVDARADQFSFCVALWEAVYGQRPFLEPADHSVGPVSALLAAIAGGPILPARGDRPRWIARLLTRGLATDPDQRWPTLHALLDAIAAHRASTARRPWRFAGSRMFGLAGIGVAVAAVASAHLVQPEPPPPHQLVPVPMMSETLPQAAGLSPDGRRLAMVVDHTLVILDIKSGRSDRVVLDHRVDDWPPTWSPDGKRILVSVIPDFVGQSGALVVDIDSHARFMVPGTGITAFLSNNEIALTSFREKSVKFIRVGEQTTATCAVDGDYTLIWNLAGTPDGTAIVETLKGDTHTFVLLRRDCQVRATFSIERVSSFALSDVGTIIALTVDGGLRELLELSLSGKIISRRRISGDIDKVLGRRRGVDYVATRVQKTHLDRVALGGLPRRLLDIEGGASFSLAPDGDTLAWVELSNHARGRAQLRRSSLRSGLQDVQPLRDDALMVGWSPDGEHLAVLIDDGRGPVVVVTDRNGRDVRHLPLRQLAREAAPVWLDDHRILAASDDYLTYQSFDLNTSEQGELTDAKHGGTYWLARSPRNGMLAMWRNGPPEITDGRAEHLWLQPLDGDPIPLHVDDAMRHYLSPSWSPLGELFVRAQETGVVSRVALDTGALTPVAQLPEMPLSDPFDNRLMFPADGGVLAVEIELGLNLWETVPDEQLGTPLPIEPSNNRVR